MWTLSHHCPLEWVALLCHEADWENEDFLRVEHPRVLRTAGSVLSRTLDGQLNRDFKFCGKSSFIPVTKREAEPLTLSDIIPPSAIIKSLSATSLFGDESALKSIFAKAIEIPSPPCRVRLDSDSTLKRVVRTAARASNVPSHYRFTEVRRGFEFHDNRPDF
jgi:serine/arginine repetitive matrix protein 2